MPKLPSALKRCDWSASSHVNAACPSCMKMQKYGRDILEVAAEVIEKHISVDSGDPARWTDAIMVSLVDEIRALKEDL